MKRPTSVSVIAWILIVMAVITLVVASTNLHNPLANQLRAMDPIPVPLQFAIEYAGLVITFVAGIAMLKGHNWGRWVYVIWSIIAIVVGFATSPIKPAIIPGLVLFLIFVFFLFRPTANAYFSAGRPTEHAQGA